MNIEIINMYINHVHTYLHIYIYIYIWLYMTTSQCKHVYTYICIWMKNFVYLTYLNFICTSDMHEIEHIYIWNTNKH